MDNAVSKVPGIKASHPVLNNGTFGILTAESPRFAAASPGGNDGLEAEIKAAGLHYEKVKGRYDAPHPAPAENSFLIHGADKAQLADWGRRYGQESVLWSRGGRHALVYTNGDKVGSYNPGQGKKIHATEPTDYYSTMQYRGRPLHFTLGINFDDLKPWKG